jgi:hypothetical protein
VLSANTSDPAPSLDAPSFTIEPAPLPVKDRSWTWWLGGGISLAVLVVSVIELLRVDFSEVVELMPASPLFWLVFFTAYFVPACTDWAIFHRLWKIPADGFTALVRKMIGNELLFGYVGELYFYTWARRRTQMTSAPFGAIKDVAILSALTGNAITLAMLALAFPSVGSLEFGIEPSTLIASVGVVLVSSSLLLIFRKRLFSLPRDELIYASAMHLVRIIATTALGALCWHLALPDVALSWWLLLAACRLLLSRLPLMPNKDIVFAGLAVFMIGHDAEIGELMTMMASLTLATHIGLGLLLSAGEAVRFKR